MDKRVATVCALLIFLAFGWLLSEKLFKAPKRSAGSLAQIVEKQNNVRRRAQNSLFWEDARVSQELFAYDTVLTLEQSSADIQFNSGVVITLNENSLIEVTPAMAGNEQLVLNKGSYEIYATQGQNLQVDTWILKSGRGSRFLVRKGPQGQSYINLLEGSGSIQGPTGQSEALNVSKTSVMTSSIDRSVASQESWLQPQDNSRFYTRSSKADVPVSWLANLKALKVKSLNSAPNKEYSFDLTAKNSISLGMRNGAYEMTMTDSNDIAQSRRVVVLAAPEIALTFPSDDQKFKLSKPVTLAWQTHEQVKSYTWEVARDKEFKYLSASGETEDDRADISTLELGDFYWRVRGKDALGFAIPAGEIRRFKVVDRVSRVRLAQKTEVEAPPEEVSDASQEAERNLAAQEEEKVEPPPAIKTPLVEDDKLAEKKPSLYFTNLGLGFNYLNYSQTIPGIGADVAYESLRPVTYFAEAGAKLGKGWKTALSYHDSPGAVKSSTTIPVSNGDYHWRTATAEGMKVLNENFGNFRGEPIELGARFGVQQHWVPFLAVQTPANTIDLRQTSLTMATFGFDVTLMKQRRIRWEVLGRYQYPITAAASDGNNYKINPTFAFDGSLGGVYQFSEDVTLGTYWYGQWHDYGFDYTMSNGQTNSGRQSLFYSNVELRFGLKF